VIREKHSLLCQLVEVRRSSSHHSAMIRADVPHPDVIAHDEQNVRLLAALLGHRRLFSSPKYRERREQYRCPFKPARLHKIAPRLNTVTSVSVASPGSG